MSAHSILHATFALERTYPVTPERVFAAWADPAAKARWFAGPTTEHELDFRVGCRETVHRGWLSNYSGGIDYTIRELRITAGGDVAFCFYLYRIAGTMTDGTQVGMWVRSTLCLCKIEGEWTITHEHTSVPFDGETGTASLHLQPV